MENLHHRCQTHRIHVYVPTFTIKNHLRIHGSVNIYIIVPWIYYHGGKTNHHQRLSLVDAALTKRRLHGLGAQRWNLCFATYRWFRWGCFGDAGFFSWGLLIVGSFWLIYILLRYTPFSSVWMCRLVWVFCCLSTWEISDIDQAKCVCISVYTLAMSISMCRFWVLMSFELLTVMIFENSPVLRCWTNMCRKHTPSRTIIPVSKRLTTMVIVSPLSDLFIADRWGWS